MAQITYTDKTALNINGDIADTNKVNASDMNEIKTVVNGNYNEVGDITNLTTTDKTSVVNAINETSGILNGLVYTEIVTLATNLSVNANSNINTATYTLSPRTGYTPIFVALNNTWGGQLVLWFCSLNDNQISWRVRNVTSSAVSGFTIQVRVLYIKSSCVAT